jgi:CRP-like cAMP-binding protein
VSSSKVESLKRVPLFGHCSAKELRAIAALGDELDVREGKVLTKEGERGREFFVLLSGTADVTKDGAFVRQLIPGDFFGEIALVSRQPRTATVTATTPVDVLVITDQAFGALLGRMPIVSRHVLQALGERLAPFTL